MTGSSLDSLALAKLCAGILDERKLEDVAIFDVAESLYITEYFVLATGLNPRHLRSAGDYLERELRKHGKRRRGVEGYRDGTWILIDFSDIVVHLFLSEQRGLYDLELLWGDCPRVAWRPEDRRAVREA